MKADFSGALEGGRQKKRRNRPVDDVQLDLFTPLSSARDAALGKDDDDAGRWTHSPAPPSEPEEPDWAEPVDYSPPDVAADIRSVLSDSSDDSDASEPDTVLTPRDGRPPLKTGIYRRPVRPPPPPPPPKKPLVEWSGVVDWFNRLRSQFRHWGLSRRLLAIVGGLIVLVALLAFWTRPKPDADVEAGLRLDLDRIAPLLDVDTTASATPTTVQTESVAAQKSPAGAQQPSAAQQSAAAPLPDWQMAGADIVQRSGAYWVRFTDPVFVSTTKISPEGMKALKAVAAKLLTMQHGARVLVIGHTDDTPLSNPTAEFRSNADIAAGRSRMAADHLKSFARKNKALQFTERTGKPEQAPYPNDSPKNRRLNRTVTIQIIPLPAPAGE